MRQAAAVWAFVTVLAILCGPARATIHVSTTGNDSADGLNWATAKRTVQAGLNAAAAGDEVWVAAGTYVERITLKAGVALYGGFAGSETALAERNWGTNVTILDGNKGGSVVTAPSGATNTTRIDGFTIRNGSGTYDGFPYFGGGIYCRNASPTIANNTITGNNVILNSTTGGGGGIYCRGSSPVIVNNRISNNVSSEGGGIYCYSSSSPVITNNVLSGNSGGRSISCSDSCSPTIANNTISGNSGGIGCGLFSNPKITSNAVIGNGGGISCSDSSPTITNNTIIGNFSLSSVFAAGISCSSGSPTITNTIVAFNSSGISRSGGTPSLRNNCVYGNVAFNYLGVTDPTGTNGNISLDPILAGVSYGNVHLQPGSPCIDTGDDSAVQPAWTDIDGQLRRQGAHVDMGADESDGTFWAAGPRAIVHISSLGDDANDGSSWLLAKRTVQAGIEAAAAAGGEVWVQAGTYAERIQLRSYAYVYGGFAGTETQKAQRNASVNTTILDGSQGGSVVTVNGVGYQVCAIDGFTIRNGTGTVSGYYNYRYGGGIYCYQGAPEIANNTITGNSARYGAGIYCASSSAATIRGNLVTANNTLNSGDGGGIYCDYSSPILAGNTISANSAFSYGGGVYCDNASPTLMGNAIADNTAYQGGGLYCAGRTAVVVNSTITGNSAAQGGGLYCAGGTPAIVNSTIAGNGAAEGAGLYCNASTATVTNTIIAANSSGICVSSGTVQLRYNCVYGNLAYNYSGLTDPTGNNGNISVDPRLASIAYGNAHIQPSSPCIGAGDDSVIQASWLDVDGQPRKSGTQVDIGADESDGTAWPTGPNIIIRVGSGGDDTNDGSSWSSAKRTIQAGIDAAVARRGDVWVQAGMYQERISLHNGVHVYGGFAGIEGDRSQRNASIHQTVLDGNRGGSVVSAVNLGCLVSTIDGFRIRNGSGTGSGSSAYGGGIYCSRSAPLIANNVIQDNVLTGDSLGGGIYCSLASPAIMGNVIYANAGGISGGGIYCRWSLPLIANNVIKANSVSGPGGGIYCDSACPTIINNTLTGNVASNGGGIFAYTSFYPTIVNTIVAFNSSGVSVFIPSSSSPHLRYNCVYGNGAYNYSDTDPTGFNGNISVDPRLASVSYGNVHLQPGSPCIDVGNDSAVHSGWTDMDGQARIIGARTDIGADESDGSPWLPEPGIVVRVSLSGNDANDGSSWALAKRTIQAGIDAAAAGGDVWVQAGAYMERVTLRSYAHIYGGFAGTETQRASRDWTQHVTVLDGQQAGSIVTALRLASAVSTLDGCLLRNGSAGVHCSYASPTIANNTITAITSGAVYCSYSSPVIANNVITGNPGRGIYCASSSPTIANNSITDNGGNGIYCASSSAPRIRGNTIAGNSVADHGGGIYCSASPATITSNVIAGNYASPYGGGIYCASTPAPTIRNNSIVGNGASAGGGIYCDSCPATILNTVVGFNSSGICVAGAVPAVRFNCIYGNTAYNVSGMADPIGVNGNISVDPLLVRLPDPGANDFGDLHLQAGSPCINTGDPLYTPPAGETDMDGQPRKVGPRVDIGADEFWWQGDGNYDGYVNVGDLQVLIQAWATQSGDAGYVAGADANSDGCINIVDLQILVGNWAKS